MKKTVFICSHLFSGSSVLFDVLNEHPRINGFRLARRLPYTNKQSILSLLELRHKLNNRSAIYMDELVHNHELSTKELYKECKFIYVIRRPESVVEFLAQGVKHKINFMVRYYSYRMRRLFEMSRRTPGAVLFTWEDLVNNRGLDMIDEYLNLKQPINFNPKLLEPLDIKSDFELPNFIRNELNETYEKYSYYIKSQNIKYWK